jgi:hypothetical protein
MEHQSQAIAEAETVSAFIVYRQADGKIVHRHHVRVLPGAKPPNEEAMVQEAHTLASRITGVSEAENAVLRVTADELERSFGQQVDVQGRRQSAGALHNAPARRTTRPIAAPLGPEMI